MGFAVYTILRNKPERKHFIWASRELLGSPSGQVPSISAKWRPLKLEMYLEILFLWFQHTQYWFSPGSVFQLLNKNRKICSGPCDFATVSHSAKIRVAGPRAFQPYTAHNQLSCSSSPGLHSGQPGQGAGSRTRGQHEKYQLESLLWIIYRKHI